MKRIWTMLALTAALTLALASVSLADVIWAPADDFLEEHLDECDYENRSYYANSPAGMVCLYEEPLSRAAVEAAPDGWVSGKTLGQIRNGHALFVQFTLDYAGQRWGVVEYTTGESGDLAVCLDGDEGGTGWVRLEELLLIYDARSFAEEHGGAFAPYDGSFDDLTVGQALRLYTYPGSGALCGQIEGDASYPVSFDSLWTDEAGLMWGHIAYHMGIRDCWVCLSDPEAEDLPASCVPDYDLYPAAELVAKAGTAAEPGFAPAPETADDALTLGLAVVLLCSGTALVGLVLLRRNKTAKER